MRERLYRQSSCPAPSGVTVSVKGRCQPDATSKLNYTRDRRPLTEIRNAFRELAFG